MSSRSIKGTATQVVGFSLHAGFTGRTGEGKKRIRLQLGKRLRELALVDLAIDSKLRGCDLVRLPVRDMALIGLDPGDYDTHSLRRTTATPICRPIKNLCAVQLLLGHTKLETAGPYLGIEVDDALEIAEHIEA